MWSERVVSVRSVVVDHMLDQRRLDVALGYLVSDWLMQFFQDFIGFLVVGLQ